MNYLGYFFLLLFLFFTACSNNTSKIELDGAKLLEIKCASCHNLNLPPKTFSNEIAPPMMAVTFHVQNFIQTPDESARIPKAISFVKDYVINPSASKSFCDKKSLKEYGVMPSQKENVTKDELEAIAKYMFNHFTQKNLNTAQKELNYFNKLPAGEKIALKNNCLTCHKIAKDLVGPSFVKIAKRYKDKKETIFSSIHHGSNHKWMESKGAIMPAFKKLSKEDVQTLTQWILSHK